MSALDEIRREREKKRDLLKDAGMNPYAATSERTHTLEEVSSAFEDLEESGDEVIVAGRVMALRRHGGSAFVDLFDGTERLQLFLSKDAVGNDLFDLFTDAIDPGDFIETTGTAFLTKREARAIAVTDWRVLTKALQAIPAEHFGIKDEDERYRKRYLDILLNQETKDLFERKALYWKASRRFLEDLGFDEVHTPMLEATTGGAEAAPFVTHHNDFDIDLYLRISVGELWQKRLMASGMTRVFEVGRVFRNEGTSPDHLQEFTNIEFYAAYVDFESGLQLMENHIKYVLDEAFAGQRQFRMKGFEVNFEFPFKRIDYVETVTEQIGIDVITATEEELRQKVTELNIEHEGDNRERLTDTLWKHCRKNIAGPVWLTGHPRLVSPLSKESEEKEGTVLRAQLIMAGAEFNNCFSELNDPADQRDRFETQQQLLDAGDSDAMMPDWEFVEMLEYGIPPTFGAATLGERFFAYLVDKPIRETQLFPLMKPRSSSERGAETTGEE